MSGSIKQRGVCLKGGVKQTTTRNEKQPSARARATHPHANKRKTKAKRTRRPHFGHQLARASVGRQVPHPDVPRLVPGDELPLVRVQAHAVDGRAGAVLALAAGRAQVPHAHGAVLAACFFVWVGFGWVGWGAVVDAGLFY